MQRVMRKEKTNNKTKILVVVDGHLVRTPDGKVWSQRIYDYSFFARYLDVFDEVRIAMRISDRPDNQEFPNLCSGPKVEFFPIEEFRGPKEYLKKYYSIRKNMASSFEGCDCAIFRIPSSVGYPFMRGFEKTGKPYAVEVVIDPWDYLSKNTINTIVRPIIRLFWTYELKRACKKANGVSYVTKYALQKRYPSYARVNGESRRYFESYYSSVSMPETYYGQIRIYDQKEQYLITHVANSISNYVKGHKELILTVEMLKAKNVFVNVEFVGEGSLVEEFVRLAREKGVEEQIHFIGAFSSKEFVRKQLLKSDMFVLPSHAEGLPRVLIEAMAVGLPCIATNVNGIPELLEEEFLVEVGDVQKLAEKILRFIKEPALMERESKRNIEVARNYSEDRLQEKRRKFYGKLKELVS